MGRVKAVFFDIGETLLERSREYAAWAQFLGVPPHTFSAVFGAVVASGGGVPDVVTRFRPGTTYRQFRAEVAQAGLIPPLAEQDLYPGVRSALTRLHERGLFIGVAGNQPRQIGDQVRALGLPVDCALVSAELGLSKPDPAFFAALAERAGCPPGDVLYVGDQLDHDVVAAGAAGLPTVRVLTGPWGHLLRDAVLEATCLAVLDSVADLPSLWEPAP